MTTNNNKKKSSAARKLIPAIGMLTVSAMMLSSSTYAWFTMNKDVEVTGLQMQATASNGLEISLGAIGTQAGNKAISVDVPAKDDISWKRAIAVSEYYKEVGKLLPASSDNALNVYKVPAENVYAGGHAVEADADVTTASKDDSATMTLQTYNAGTNSLATIGEGLPKTSSDNYTAAEESAARGNYIDIPMWIRAANSTATNIYATVTITDPNTENGSDLVKAVRVAIIPVSSATNSTDACAVGYTSTTYSGTDKATVTPLSGSAAKIFGLKATSSSAVMDSATSTDWPTYHNGTVLKAEGEYGASVLGATSMSEARGLTVTTVDPTQVFTIPAATSDDYARVGFVARIWLEGESIYCEDATAMQDWNIDFHFSTDSTAIAALNSGSGSGSDTNP